MSRPLDYDKIERLGSEILIEFQASVRKVLGPDYLTSPDLEAFTEEAGAVSYAVNFTNAIIASLMIERFVHEGATLDEAHAEIQNALALDAAQMADEGRARYEHGLQVAAAMLARLTKKSTSH